MPEIMGKELAVGVSVEKVRGTAQLTAEKWMKNVETTVALKVEKIIRESSMGIMEDSDAVRITKKWVEGELNGVLHADAIGYFFYSLFGSVSTSPVATGVYDHEFTVGQSASHPSLTIFVKDGGVQQKSVSNCMVNTLEISATVDDYVRFKTDVIGKAEGANVDSVSRDTEYDFIGKDVEIKFATSEAGLTGATATKVKNITLKFDQGLVADHVLGAYEPDDIYNSKMSIEGEFTANFDDTTFKDLYSGETYKYMQIKITGSQTIGAASNPTITVLLNRVQIMEWSRAGGADELVTQPVSFKAFYNQADTQMAQVILRNVTSEYDTPVSD